VAFYDFNYICVSRTSPGGDSVSSETIRIDHSKDYTIISNLAIRDKRLSFRARGLHHLLLSYPDGWEVKVEHLANESDKEGRDAIASALKELEEFGYLIRNQIRDKGRIVKYESVIRELPIDNPPKPTGRRGKKPQPDLPDTAQPQLDLPDTVNPQPDKPDTVNPQPDKPDTANPVHNKYLFKEESNKEGSIPPIVPQDEKNLEEGGSPFVEVVLEKESPTNNFQTQAFCNQQTHLLTQIVPAHENENQFQALTGKNPKTGKSYLPWQVGLVDDQGILRVDINPDLVRYVAKSLVSKYRYYKKMPVKELERETIKYITRAQYHDERREEIDVYWRDFENESFKIVNSDEIGVGDMSVEELQRLSTKARLQSLLEQAEQNKALGKEWWQ
jgi:hypothetical protein